MSFSFSSLVRLLVLLAVGSTIFAVGLAKFDPPRPASRSNQLAKYSNINEFFLNNVLDRTPMWLDSETGVMAAYPLEDGDVLEVASCSPWVDEKGQHQVVGRWSTRTKDGPMSMSTDFGIARYAFPSGQMLDHVSTETVPVGPPCWYPGIRARILFAAGDGSLYHYAFESEPWVTSSDSKAGRDLKPWQVTWRCLKPSDGKVFLSDLSWPVDPRLGGNVVVVLSEQTFAAPHQMGQTRNNLWWLKLNFAGTEIVDCGRLLFTGQSEEQEANYDHRNPMIGTLPDGRLVLAYLRQRHQESGWEVRIAPIELDPERQTPRAHESQSVLLASKCPPSHPTFSPDGRWLNVITNPSPNESVVARISTSGLFAGTK